MQLSTTEKVLYVKIVYYGPGLSGKTTNLESIHRLTDPDGKQPLVSLRTEGDRTLFFDLLPFDLGQLSGYDVRLKVYTVPGQVQYDITRRQVLAGADGIVFVADSQPAQLDANIQMIKYLKSNLRMNGLDPNTIPLVFQWNKRDLPAALPPEELARELNYRADAPALTAVAPDGTGVLETFREITLRTLEEIARRAPSNPLAAPGAGLRQKVSSLFGEMIARSKQIVTSGPRPTAHLTAPLAASHAHAARDRSGKEVLELDDLLFEAVQASLDMSERLTRAASGEEAIDRMRRERKALLRLVQIATISPDVEGVLRMGLAAVLAGIDLKAGSALVWEAKGQPLREIATSGRERDPLNSVQTPGLGSVATTLLERGQVTLCHDVRDELMFGASHPAIEGIRGALALPVRFGRQTEALLLVYLQRNDRELDGDDMEFASLVTALVGLAARGALQAV